MRVTLCTVSVLLLFLPSEVRTQENSCISGEKVRTSCSEPATCSQQLVPPPQGAHQEEEHPRLFWVLPTYSVSNRKLPSLLSPHDKFRIFVKNASDPFNLGYAAFEAGLKQANNDLSGYGQGAAGYGKRLGAGLADDTSSRFFTTYFFPSLFHQDPRYFRQGSGPFRARVAHAIIRPIVTREDSGGNAFNWSGLLGGIAATGLSNAYYPASDRGVGTTFRRVVSAIPSSVIDHLIDEFGPDLEKRFLHKK